MEQTPARPVLAVVTGVEEYQTRLLRGIGAGLVPHGVPLLVHANDPSVNSVPPLLRRLLHAGGFSGIVTAPGVTTEEERQLIELLDTLDLPVVHIGQDVPDAITVHADNVAGMRALMAHLLDECGARNPAMVRGMAHQPDAATREQVFRDELRRRGISVQEELIVDGRSTYDHAYEATRALFGEHRDIDVVVAVNDSSAFGVLDALTDMGYEVPADVMVTGFDDDPAAALHWPGLTTIDQDVEGQGRLAAALLMDEITGHRADRGRVVPSRLVVRGSTQPGGDRGGDRLAEAHTMNRAIQGHVAARDAVLGLNRVMNRCRSMDRVATALASRLDNLGIRRCFLAVYESVGSEIPVTGERARLILDYRDGKTTPVDDEVFPTHQLLPEPLRTELQQGMIVLQPLSGLDRDLGYVLYEQVRGVTRVAEALRHDLSRTLDSVASTQSLEDHAATLEALVAQRTQELKRANAELQRSLMVDGLTRIANRIAFERHLEAQWKELDGRELALLILDVDLFKAYNDRYGHVHGDEALKIVASCLQESARHPGDLATRYGGEEFAVVLPDSGVEAASAVATRFRALLAEAAIPHSASSVAPVVTASIGIAVARVRPGLSLAVVVNAADQALYRAKALGRNRIAFADRI